MRATISAMYVSGKYYARVTLPENEKSLLLGRQRIYLSGKEVALFTYKTYRLKPIKMNNILLKFKVRYTT